MYADPFSPKQVEFILQSNAKYNLAHGSVRSGKTIGVLFKFLQEVQSCPGESIWMIGRSLSDVYHNCVQALLDHPSFKIFRPFCTWRKHERVLSIGAKNVICIGAGDEGAMGAIQGKTFDLCYCNEMTLYPANVIQMIFTRLSMPHSKLYADMNPVQPNHICKQWIDFAAQGDKKYYALHWTVDDNPYLEDSFKEALKQTLTGLFLRRNYYGEWCLAEGAIFDFFDKSIHVDDTATGTTLYWVAGVDYGTDNAFACVLIRVSQLPRGKQMWVEKEYYYDSKDKRQKSPSEYVESLQKFFEGYAIRAIYLDPSAAFFRTELARRGLHTVDTNNEVYDGIITMTDALKSGRLLISPSARNLIREIQSYVWDPKASKHGKEAPLKQDDHACDALRYAVKSHAKSVRFFIDEEDAPANASLIGKKGPLDTGHGWTRF